MPIPSMAAGPSARCARRILRTAANDVLAMVLDYGIRTVVGVKARISREKTNEYYFCVSKKWFGPGTIYCQEDLIIIIIIILKGGYD